MASSASDIKLSTDVLKDREKEPSYLSPKTLPQIKIDSETVNIDTDNTSIKTDDTSTGNDNASTGTDDTSTETDDSIYAPDGGWGWMVTMAGFLVAFIVDGIVASFGLLLPELLTTYEAKVSLASFPPALLVAMYLLSGPLTAYLVKRWGCRQVGFCGGLVAALGVAGSAYAPNIELFILSFGLVAGVGSGLIYLPSITMVNMYFHKKRGVVAGIITSGSGFGLLALAPLTEMLIEEYGWRGCYLIMSAITLNFCVCACLMRPLHRPPHPHPSQPLDQEGVVVVEGDGGLTYPLLEGGGGDKLSLVSLEELDDTEQHSPLPHNTHLELEREHSHGHHNAHLEVEREHSHGHHNTHLEVEREHSHGPHNTQHVCLLSSIKNLFLGQPVLGGGHVSESHGLGGIHVLGGSHAQVSSGSHMQVGAPGPRQALLTRSRSQGHLERGPPHHKSHSRAHVNVLSTWLACQVPPSLSRHTLQSHHSSDNMAAQEHHGGHHVYQKRKETSGSQWMESGRKQEENKIAWGQSLPSMPPSDDILKQVVIKNQLKTNIPSLPPGKAPREEADKEEADSCSLIECDPSSSEDSTCLGSDKRPSVAQWVRESRAFLLFLAGAFLIQLVCNIPTLLAPSYAYQFDVSKEEVATILSVYGLLNTVGRLLAGVLVFAGVRTLHVYNMGILLSGLTCFAFPFSTTFTPICVCLALHGFFLGAFPPLQSVILVEYLGLDRLTSTFGTMCLVKAFASTAGAPLAGVLVTQTGTYTVPMAACGAVLVLAAIFHQMMDCCR